MFANEGIQEFLLEDISKFLNDQSVTEVVINKPGEVGIESRGQWSWHDIPSMDFDKLDSIGILSCFGLAKDFGVNAPIGLATLPGGQRLTIIRPPVTPKGVVSATIRIPSHTPRSVNDLDFSALMEEANVRDEASAQVDRRLAEAFRNKDWPEFFSGAVRDRKTILATGSTGSGKTQFIKRLMSSIPTHERILTLEDTDEFGPLAGIRNRVRMFYGSAGVSALDLAEVALRMRPDRVMMQELRGAEAFSFLRILLGGHPGSCTTLHAERGDASAFDALTTMVKTHPAGKEIPDEKLTQLLRKHVDIIVWCHRDSAKFKVPYVWFRNADHAIEGSVN